MNDTKMLVGSLSNDLFRVANLAQRGSIKGAQRFLVEARRWAEPLTKEPVKAYVQTIAREIIDKQGNDVDVALAERYLMYGILLQNYALHFYDNANSSVA